MQNNRSKANKTVKRSGWFIHYNQRERTLSNTASLLAQSGKPHPQKAYAMGKKFIYALIVLCTLFILITPLQF
ncbi:MAG: hypothetical protein P8046_08505 [Anaerolineales bacterium]